MINRVLTMYASQMEQYMGTYFHRPEGMVEVGAIGAQVDEEPCKIQISLLNVERETAQGMNMGKWELQESFPVCLIHSYTLTWT